MSARSSFAQTARLDPSAGIAIGPILFIIAVLGILAAAIAAGSGSFTASTTNEGNRAKAAALIDIGQTLKLGFDHVIGNGVDFDSVVFDPDETTHEYDLFSPVGGGITAPSNTMARTLTDVWHYLLIAIPKLGTTTGSRVAVLRVSDTVCDEINLKANGLVVGTAHTLAADIGSFAVAETVLNDGSAWPSSLQGKTIGCVENLNAAPAAGSYFFQVMGVR